MQHLRLTSLVFAVLLASGCSSPPIPMLYTAQTSIRGKSGIAAGTFKYLPAERKQLLPNQIENTASGKVLLDGDVASYVKRAFTLELDRSGFSAADPQTDLSCDITSFKADDLGFSVDWSLDLSCALVERANDHRSRTATASVRKTKTAKFGGLEILQRYINNLILEAYEQVFSPETIKTLPSSVALPGL